MQLVTHHPDETVRLGIALAKVLEPGDILFLQGELGGGKTTFVRGIMQGLKGSGAVSSPTFMLLHLYNAKLPIYHFDFYRLQSADEFKTLGVEEYLNGDGVSLIEWPEKFAGFLPKADFTVDFQFEKKSDARTISITSNNENRLKTLENITILENKQ